MKHKATKRILSLLLAMVMLIGLLPSAAIPVFAVEESDIYAEDPNYEHGYFLGGKNQWEGGTWVREVYDWDDMDQVFENLASASMTDYGYVTIKLMENLELSTKTSSIEEYYMKEYRIYVGLSNIIFDFNGHTLSGEVNSPAANVRNFINIQIDPGNQITFTDSVGGGGINFNAYSFYDNNTAALYFYTIGNRGEGYNVDNPNSYPAKIIFNGGTYNLSSKIDTYAEGSRLSKINYRGTVIADYVDVEINGGTFIAVDAREVEDATTENSRELSAFGTVITNSDNFPDETNPEYGVVIPFEETGRTVINGGSFISDGYAFHHFDNCNTYLDNHIYENYSRYAYCEGEYYVSLDSHFHMNYPTINGGYFEGQLGFTGLTYTDSEGNEELSERPASEIIPKTAYFVGVDRDGNKSYDITNWTWDDLHDMQKCTVVSSELFEFKVTHEGTSNLTNLTRTVKQSDTFEMSWTVPDCLEDLLETEVTCQPTIIVTRPNSNIEPQTYAKSKITLDYSEYPNDVNIRFGLYIFVEGEDALLQQATYLYKDFRIDVKRVYTATDNCLHCYVTGDNGWDEIVEGETCSFVILPNDYYELTDPDALEVYVNGEPITPSGNGGYYVDNVTEDLDIYCDGSAFTSYSNLTVTANGKTVTEKIFDGGTYTFKTLAEFGATVPEGSTFTGWKIGGKTYQPGETFTVTGTGEIAVNAAFTGLHNITVENGKAYADEAHTIPISAAAEDQVIYIVADPAPEGKVFSYWSHQIATAGGGGSFGNYDAAQTTYKVYYSDVVLTPVYETQIDNIVINGMTKPSAGVAIDNSDYSYKWGCSVPADAGYTLGISYWYDITDGEHKFAMSDGDVFQIGHTYRFKARIHLKADHIYPANPEDIAVVLSGIDAEDYQCTINEVGYTSATIYFEFTCEREEPDTSIERPEGSGTVGDPFKISTVGELYWFTGFTNNYVAVGEDFAVERNKAHAILMNDITVNPELLTEDGALNGTSGFAQWTPIGYYSDYSGTFDGQGYSISGLYYNTKGYQHEYYGFIARMGENGVVKDLTLKDTYFYTEFTGNGTPYAAGIVAFAPEASNRIENCHFDGVVGAESSNRGSVVGGITAVTGGKIQDCTAKGRVLGADSYSGSGKAGGIAGTTYDTAMISDCTNYAEVTCWDSGTGVGYAGGIAGYLAGTVKDCCNRGVINGYDQGNYNYVGGIVGWARGTAEQRAVISRCFNEASFAGSGIVDYIYSSGTYYEGYVTVKNCYNTGSVTNGIVGTAKGVGISITYCHNVGITTKPIIDSIINADDIEMKNCYYVETSHYDTDRVEMTEAMLAEEFADGTVLALLNNGHWTQGEDDEYPVLGEIPGVTVSGMVTSFGKESEQTTVQLFPSGSDTPAFSITLTGTHAMYSFTGVEAGTYTMKVSKANHVTREYTVVVGNSPIPLDAKIHLLGDIDGNGTVTTMDAMRANSHARGVTLLTDYALKCADVVGTDGTVTTMDAMRINAHAKGSNLLW